jgi:hypothetical protein
MSPDDAAKVAHITQRIHRVMAEELITDDTENDEVAEMALAMVVAGFIVCGDQANPELWKERMDSFMSLTTQLMPIVHAEIVAPMFKDRRQ